MAVPDIVADIVADIVVEAGTVADIVAEGTADTAEEHNRSQDLAHRTAVVGHNIWGAEEGRELSQTMIRRYPHRYSG